MRSDPIKMAAVVGVMVTAGVLGCEGKPGLTEKQVDQFLSVQQTIADEQASLRRGQDALEADRRRWAERERRDPIIASAIESAALLTVCCLPVVVIIVLLFLHRPCPPGFDIDEALLLELSDHGPAPRSLSTRKQETARLEDRRTV